MSAESLFLVVFLLPPALFVVVAFIISLGEDKRREREADATYRAGCAALGMIPVPFGGKLTASQYKVRSITAATLRNRATRLAA